MPSKVDPMQRGAVLVMDALGWKELRRKHSVQDLLRAMTWVRGATKNVETSFEVAPEALAAGATGQAFPTTAIFLSDTIVVTFASAGDEQDAVALARAVSTVRLALHASLSQPTPFLFRGAIAFGSFFVQDTILIGDAIDEAASAHELAEGAFVWLLPSCRHVVRKYGVPEGTRVWPVPLKNRPPFRTPTVVPAHETQDAGRRILATFESPNLDVAIKRANTAAFLRELGLVDDSEVL